MSIHRSFCLLMFIALVSACAVPATPIPAATAVPAQPTTAPVKPTTAPATPTLAPTAVPAQPTTAPVKPTTAPTPLAPPSAVPTVTQPTAATANGTAVNGTFQVNGRSLLIKCIGSGSPTVILEPGAGQAHFDVELIQQTFAKWTMACAYDRAHTGGRRSAQDVVDDLHGLLAAAKIPGPFLLLGRDEGGMFVQLYAREFPDQVAGVVSLNPPAPAHPWLDEVQKVFNTQEYSDEEAYYKGQNAESFDLLTSSDQLAAAPKPPPVPFAVFIGTEAQCEGDETCLKGFPIYVKLEHDVAGAWQRGSLTQVDTPVHDVDYNHLDDIVAAAKSMVSKP